MARPMNFTHLWAFFEVARAGSVSKGAARLHVSQPAVTREIKHLEHRLGVTLFHRQPRGIALTEAGVALYRQAEQIFALAHAAEKEMEEIAGLKAGHLSIGASVTTGVYFVPAMLAQFSAKFPDIEIELQVTNTKNVEAGVRARTFSLGFVEGPFDNIDLQTHSIGTDEIVAVVAAGHPLAVKRRLTAKQLVEHPIILREPGSGTRAIIEKAYARAKLGIQSRVSINNSGAIKRMLFDKRAIAYVSSLSVKDEVARGDLVVLPIHDMHIKRPLHMIWLKKHAHAPITQAFLDFIRKTPA